METEGDLLLYSIVNQDDSSSQTTDTYITAKSETSRTTAFDSTSINVEDVILTAIRDGQRDADIDFNDSLSLFDCLAATTRIASESIRTGVVKTLENYKKQFQIILQVTGITSADGTGEKKGLESERQAYEHLISQCNDFGTLDDKYLAVYIYASATSLNRPIYIFCQTDLGFVWEFYPQLFEFEAQPVSNAFVTMYMTPYGKFSRVATETVPAAVGVVGKFSRWLKDTALGDIDVPRHLLTIPEEKKEEMIMEGNADTLRQACNAIRNKRESNEQDDINVLLTSGWAFEAYCKILIKNRDFRVLAIGFPDMKALETESEYIKCSIALCELDEAIVERNIEVGTFVALCKDSCEEFDIRRKNVNTAVIASPSVALGSGALAIIGLVLAPFSFGASLGLSIAGGAIGVAASATSGGTRAVEAVKQNTKVKDIKEKLAIVEKKETEVSEKLSLTKQLFRNAIPTFRRVQLKGPGKSKRGILAVGSAVRGIHGGAGIALAAVRLAVPAAATAATVLGPLYVVFDVILLAEAVHNKRKGDKTLRKKLRN